MTWYDILILVIIAAIFGGIAQVLGVTARGGLIADISLGFIGALLGVGTAFGLELPDFYPVSDGVHFPMSWAILGAVLLVALFRDAEPLSRRRQEYPQQFLYVRDELR